MAEEAMILTHFGTEKRGVCRCCAGVVPGFVPVFRICNILFYICYYVLAHEKRKSPYTYARA